MARLVSLKIVDYGLDNLFKTANKIVREPTTLEVGYLNGMGGEAIHGDSGLTVASMAAIHEFGAPAANIQARPFMSSTFKLRRKAYAAMLKRRMLKVIEGKMTARYALEDVGDVMIADIQKRILDNDIKPADLQATIDRKVRKGWTVGGEAVTLYERGTLMRALARRVAQKRTA